MLTIKENLNEFTRAIAANASIACNARGEWHYECWLMRLVRWIFCLENRRLANVAQAFNSFLDQQEAVPVLFTPQSTAFQIQTIKTQMAAAQALEKALWPRRNKSNILSQFNELKRRVVALQYRYESVNGGLDKTDLPANAPDRLRAIAMQWKDKQHLLDPHEKKLNEGEENFLKDAARYPEFLKCLYRDKHLQELFFKWMRDKNPVDALVEFPGRHLLIRESRLSKRIGLFRNHMLRIIKKSEKLLTILCEGKRVSILDDNRRITFKKGYTLTVSQIFKNVFGDKNHSHGNLEVFRKGGIQNWNTNQIGRYNPVTNSYDRIDLSAARRKDWWDQLPDLEELSLEEAQERYGSAIDGTLWGGRIVSTRERRDLSFKGNHSYVEVAIPTPNGSYKVRTFGKSSATLPRHWWQYAKVMGSTEKGVILYPDPSIFHPSRQHRGFAFTMTSSEGQDVMDWIRQSIHNGWIGNMAYQILTENCAKWAEEIRGVLGNKIPKNLLRVSFFDSQPEGCYGTIFKLVKRMPTCIQNGFFNLFFWPLGSTNSVTVVENGKPRIVSLSRLKPWRQGGTFRIPAVQIMRLENGELRT